MTRLEDRLQSYGAELSVAAERALDLGDHSRRRMRDSILMPEGRVTKGRAPRLVWRVALLGGAAAIIGSILAGPFMVTNLGSAPSAQPSVDPSGRGTEPLGVGDSAPIVADISAGVGYTILDNRFPVLSPGFRTDVPIRSSGNDAVLSAAPGSSVIAMADGRVVAVGSDALGSILRMIDADGNVFIYRGLRDVPLVVGDRTLGGRTVGTFKGRSLVLRVVDPSGAAINTPELLRALAVASIPTRSVASAGGKRITVAAEHAERLLVLLQDAKRAGHALSGSGYREPRSQLALRRAHCGTSLYDLYLAPASSCSPPTARIGSSPHLRGLAVDFTIDGRAVAADSPAHRWLTRNAGRYGLQGVTGEPWHWEWPDR